MNFGTDGIRGRWDRFNDEFLSRFASALFLKFGECSVCIGRDTRLSGERIVEKLCELLISYGINVFDCGIVPTPALAYLASKNGCIIGIMVSASHNPPEYNGIKLFSGEGAKIESEVEKELEQLFSRHLAPKNGRFGKVRLLDVGEYEKALLEKFKDKLKGTRVLIDACYGATVGVAKRVFEKLGCDVFSINDVRDGARINVECGATCVSHLLKACAGGEYDLAFAYDGDGDRVICVKGGSVYNGDQIAYAYANYLGEKLNPKAIVGTLNSNLGMEKALENKGVELVRADVGDKNVYKEMKKRGALVGGESSGHVIFSEHCETGDGILTSLMVCLMDKERGLENLVDMVDYPVEETFVEASEVDKENFKSNEDLKEDIAKIVSDNVRVVVRPSGTEPKIRILVEAERYESAREKAEEIKSIIMAGLSSNIRKEIPKNEIMGIQKTVFDQSKFEEYAKQGVVILSPETTFIEEGVKIGQGSVVYPFNVIRGKTEIAKNVTIYSYCDLTDTIIGEGADLRSTYAMQAVIGKNSTIGPFATLRKGAVIGEGCRVGDYVEVKNSVLGNGVKAAHLSYIGDATIGAKTNVGCGTVFANYNGKIKRKTEVGEGVFIGCNSNLIAPLKIGDNSYVAGGSTITNDIPPNKFVISRVCEKVTDKR